LAALGIEVPAKFSNKRKILKDSEKVKSADFKFLEGKYTMGFKMAGVALRRE
jgi:hypothetical protein